MIPHQQVLVLQLHRLVFLKVLSGCRGSTSRVNLLKSILTRKLCSTHNSNKRDAKDASLFLIAEVIQSPGPMLFFWSTTEPICHFTGRWLRGSLLLSSSTRLTILTGFSLPTILRISPLSGKICIDKEQKKRNSI